MVRAHQVLPVVIIPLNQLSVKFPHLGRGRELASPKEVRGACALERVRVHMDVRVRVRLGLEEVTQRGPRRQQRLPFAA